MSRIKFYSFQVTVFDQSWTNTREVTKSACKPEPVKANKGKRSITEEAQPVLDVKTEEVKPIVVHHPIVGGFQPADVNSEEVKAMAAFATESLSSALNSGKRLYNLFHQAKIQEIYQSRFHCCFSRS